MSLTKVNNQVIQYPYRRNFVMNGDSRIWQRGLSTTINANASGLLADRFKLHNVTDVAFTYAQSQSVPTYAQSGHSFTDTMLFKANAADTSIAANQYAVVTYYLEGYDYRILANKTVTISFWVRSSLAGIYCFSYIVEGKSYTVEYTINSTDTWEKKIITATLNPNGTPVFNSDLSLQLVWTLAAGSDFRRTTDSWQSSMGFASANQVNFAQTINNEFKLAGVQLELGTVATPFEHTPMAEELALCQRYFEIGSNAFYPCIMVTTTIGYVTSPMLVQKRANVGSNVTLTSPQIYLNTTWYNTTSTLNSGDNKTLIFTYYDTNHTYMVGGSYLAGGIWTASAEF